MRLMLNALQLAYNNIELQHKLESYVQKSNRKNRRRKKNSWNYQSFQM